MDSALLRAQQLEYRGKRERDVVTGDMDEMLELTGRQPKIARQAGRRSFVAADLNNREPKHPMTNLPYHDREKDEAIIFERRRTRARPETIETYQQWKATEEGTAVYDEMRAEKVEGDIRRRQLQEEEDRSAAEAMAAMDEEERRLYMGEDDEDDEEDVHVDEVTIIEAMEDPGTEELHMLGEVDDVARELGKDLENVGAREDQNVQFRAMWPIPNDEDGFQIEFEYKRNGGASYALDDVSISKDSVSTSSYDDFVQAVERSPDALNHLQRLRDVLQEVRDNAHIHLDAEFPYATRIDHPKVLHTEILGGLTIYEINVDLPALKHASVAWYQNSYIGLQMINFDESEEQAAVDRFQQHPLRQEFGLRIGNFSLTSRDDDYQSIRIQRTKGITFERRFPPTSIANQEQVYNDMHDFVAGLGMYKDYRVGGEGTHNESNVRWVYSPFDIRRLFKEAGRHFHDVAKSVCGEEDVFVVRLPLRAPESEYHLDVRMQDDGRLRYKWYDDEGNSQDDSVLSQYLAHLEFRERLSLAVRLKLVIAKATKDELVSELSVNGVNYRMPDIYNGTDAVILPFDVKADAQRYTDDELTPCAVAAGWANPDMWPTWFEVIRRES